MHGTIKGAIYGDNVGNGRLFTIDDFCKCRAKIINNISTEQDNGQEVISRDNKKFYIRYSKQLDTMEQNIKSKKYRKKTCIFYL